MKFLLLAVGFFFTLPSLAAPKACKIKENMKMKIDAIASNIANLHTTRTADGRPYLRKELICKAEFCVVVSRSEFIEKYDPSHPDADSGGYVRLPKIDLKQEMNAIVEASQKYELAEKDCLAQSNSKNTL